MYRLLGDIVIDTDELIEMLEKNQIRVAENITNATKRDDAVALRILVPLSELGESGEISDEEQMDRLMQQAEEVYDKKLRQYINESLSYRLYAYHYNEVENAIVLNLAIMDREIGRRKLEDVLKRLFDV
ncbi:MAG: hypothetical protein Q4D77_06750 [Peptostreptococcaceae bacterium]|nr:hypothetical protein [Peptostreptococcaceae bacterium]